MVFFVLSGYLVGGGVVRSAAAGRWSWGDYLLARGVRLYVVLVPALVLTAVWDRIGLETATGLGNDDTAKAIVTVEQVAAHSDPMTFLGNLAFLQTILVPTYGSNTPLWSLANEAWYYLIFPCLWLAGGRGVSVGRRIAYVVAALGMLVFVGPEIAALFPAWLFGVGVGLAPRFRWLGSGWTVLAAGVPLFAVLGLVGLGKIPHGYPAEYAVAVSFVPFLYVLLHRTGESGSGVYARGAAALAGCSYTLYLTHLPVLVCLRSFWTLQHPWQPDPLHWAFVGSVCAACIAYAYVLSLATEAQTDRVRRWVVGRLRGRTG